MIADTANHVSISSSRNIYAALAKVMREVESIGKDRKNQQQGWNFRGIDDVYNAIHGPLANAGVVILPAYKQLSRDERQTKNGGVMTYTIVEGTFRFVAEDGSEVQAVTIGEASDTGDKSFNKAMSVAMKYAIFQVFAIPTEDGENHDPDYNAHEKRGKPPAAKPPAPAAKLGPSDADKAWLAKFDAAITAVGIPAKIGHEWLGANLKAQGKKLADLNAKQRDGLLSTLSKPERVQELEEFAIQSIATTRKQNADGLALAITEFYDGAGVTNATATVALRLAALTKAAAGEFDSVPQGAAA